MPDESDLGLIQHAIARRSYRYTVHTALQRLVREIEDYEIIEAILNGEVVEDYPNHRFGPCCLILGWTGTGEALHIVCSVRPVVDVITVYRPSLIQWLPDLRTRRRK